MCDKEEMRMSSSIESESWLERWWAVLVILLGVFFALLVSMWNPAR
jgi:hypothetical protein